MDIDRAIMCFLVFLAVLTGLVMGRTNRSNESNWSNGTSTSPTTTIPITTQPQPTTFPITPALPAVFSLKNVPFTVQAPSANWDATHEEACEEAAILVAVEYFQGKNQGKLAVDYAENQLQEIIAWEKQKFGYFEDTNSEQVKTILEAEFNLKAEIISNPTTEQIKKAIYQGKLVIAPTAGRLLKNPYFKQPGPIYHMLVIAGWDASGFIVQDVGTKRGQNYHYQYGVLMNAIHDLYENAKPPLDENKMEGGSKKIITVTEN